MTDGTALAARLLALDPAEIAAAAARIERLVRHTPLLDGPAVAGRTIRLKAEHQQTTGSFKIRTAAHIVAQLPTAALTHGVVTPSAGNFARALAVALGEHHVPLTVHLPDSVPQARRAALEALGARIEAHPFEAWWRIMEKGDAGGQHAFVHPVRDPDGIVGNATLGRELAMAWPAIDTVVSPIGGGGLIAGLALALRGNRPVQIIAAELDGAAPLAAAIAAGRPTTIIRRPSFATGGGSQQVLEVMWPLLRELVTRVVTVSEAEALAARDLLARAGHHVEPQAAIALAAAMAPTCGGSNVAVILSGGNAGV